MINIVKLQLIVQIKSIVDNMFMSYIRILELGFKCMLFMDINMLSKEPAQTNDSCFLYFSGNWLQEPK